MRIISDADRSCESIIEALLGALPVPEAAFAANFGVSNWLACATVVAHERAACRLIVPDEKVALMAELAGEMGLHAHVGQVRMLERPNSVPGTYHNGSFVFKPCRESSAIVYFGVTSRIAEGTEQVELIQDHALLGRLFGYPECCAMAFAASKSLDLDKLPSTITSLGPFPRAMNPVSPYIFGGINLLFHFPCSPDCCASLALSEDRQCFLERVTPAATALREHGAGIALYGADVGMGLITGYRETVAGELEIDEVVTSSATTIGMFGQRARCTLRLFDPHRFELEGRLFQSPNTFAARFI